MRCQPFSIIIKIKTNPTHISSATHHITPHHINECAMCQQNEKKYAKIYSAMDLAAAAANTHFWKVFIAILFTFLLWMGKRIWVREEPTIKKTMAKKQHCWANALNYWPKLTLKKPMEISQVLSTSFTFSLHLSLCCIPIASTRHMSVCVWGVGDECVTFLHLWCREEHKHGNSLENAKTNSNNK